MTQALALSRQGFCASPVALHITSGPVLAACALLHVRPRRAQSCTGTPDGCTSRTRKPCTEVISPHPLELLQVLQLRLELVQVGIRVAAEHAAVQRVPEHLRTPSSGLINATAATVCESMNTSCCSHTDMCSGAVSTETSHLTMAATHQEAGGCFESADCTANPAHVMIAVEAS